jgi:hypothetical protein
VPQTQPVSTPREPAQVDIGWPEPARTRDLLTLLEVSRAIASTLELEPLLELILDQLKAVADYAGASVCVVEGEMLRVVASRGSTRESREPGAVGLRLPLLRGGTLWETISRQEPAIIPNVRGEGALAEGYRTWLGSDLGRRRGSATCAPPCSRRWWCTTA